MGQLTMTNGGVNSISHTPGAGCTKGGWDSDFSSFVKLMSYSLLWFVKINTELLRGVFTTQRFDTPV